MRILHTGDWHVGKRLGRHDRMADFSAVLDEIVGIAADQAVDLVLVAGDLFDRAAPSIDALRLVLETLDRLADRRPVVAVAGNHDSADLFDLLAPLVRDRQVHLVGHPAAPDDGGVLELAAGGERVLIGCLPFVREGHAVDFMRDADGWHGAYADRIAALCHGQTAHLRRHGRGAVRLLMGHFTVPGVHLGEPGTARGERPLHLGDAYMASATELAATDVQYLAMGHIHLPQAVPGAAVPARYCGSPLELDFGEAGEPKQVLIVELEADADRPPAIRPIRLHAGRRLIRARGSFEALLARNDAQHHDHFGDAYLDLVIDTTGPDPGLADRARHAFPHLIKVRAEYPRADQPTPVRTTVAWDDLYRGYFRQAHQTEPDDALVDAFREVFDAVTDASP